MDSHSEIFTALVIQPHVHVAEDRADINRNLERVCNLIDFGVGYFWELPRAWSCCPSTSSRE